MIDPKAEPIAHRPPYKRIDLGARQRRFVCPYCGTEDPSQHNPFCHYPSHYPREADPK